MKKTILLLLVFATSHTFSQTGITGFNAAYKAFATDPDFKHASISLYVVNNTTGKVLTEINTQTGLAPASTQKIITAATAYELLGEKYVYKTTLGYTGKKENGTLNGDVIITGSGDPTLGSWRYTGTKEDKIIASFKKALSQAGINAITGNVLTDESLWQSEVTPDGWSWQDIGNYYGAGATTLNWRENQYDLLLRSGNTIGTPVSIAGTIPTFVEGLNLRSVATAAAKGTGDRVYIYHPLNQVYGYVRGTIPIGESKFSISGAMPHPAKQLAVTLEAELKKITPEKAAAAYPLEKNITGKITTLYTHESPTVDSISHWFLKRSINLYGEVLVKTFAAKEGKYGETDEGIKALQNFWKSKGISAYALNMMDGSGLSPGNRITTESLVQVLMYAKKQSWFASYYDGFPVINGIRMKSGSINGVIGYTGFVKNKSGDEYAFAFIVNNYNGRGSDVRTKMWKLLDQLK